MTRPTGEDEMTEMTDERAAEVLAAHNEWRRYDGETGEPGAPAMGDPAELGRAIAHAVSRLRSQPPAEAQAQDGGEVRAWMRRWAFDGVDVMALPKNERPHGWQLRSTTEAKCLDDDVPLCAAPPSAPVAQGGGDGLGEGGRYWRERAEFWRSAAVALGWREARDAANGEAPPPSTPVEECPDCTNGQQCDSCSRDEQAVLESSAPVGVEAAADVLHKLRRLALVIREHGTCAPLALDHIGDDLERALAQQPAAVDEEAVDWHVAEGQCIASVQIARDGTPIVICYGRDHPTGRYVLAAQQGGGTDE